MDFLKSKTVFTLQKKHQMKTFILIHGSWHSSWNWHKVIPIIENKGHKAIAIDLPGMGRDKTPINEVKFSSTVQKICDLIDGIEGKVILLGHSKNGILISQVAEYRPNKIEKLIYLAAYLIPNGKTQREYSAQDTEGVLKPFVVIDENLKASYLKPEIYKEGLYHDCEDSITELAKLLSSFEPIESGMAPLNLSDKNFGSIPKYYIECTEDKAVTTFIQKKMYTETVCNKVYSLKTSHSPFLASL
jgi:pimeloyl-ACP methyl ester carboxylesterase